MKTKRLISVIIIAVLMLSLFGCSAKNKPLYTLTDFDFSEPESINITVGGAVENAIIDKEYIGKVTEAFMAIVATGKGKAPESEDTMTVEFISGDEKITFTFCEDTVTMTHDGETHICKVASHETLSQLIEDRLRNKQAAEEGYDTLIDESNIRISVNNSLRYESDGTPIIELYIINGNADTVALRLTDKKADGEKCPDSGVVYIPGGGELGVSLPVEADNEIKESVSFRIEAGFEEDETAAFASSDIYTITL